MIKQFLLWMSSVLALLSLAACGGGGGGGAGSTVTALNSANGTYTTATLKVDLVGTLPAGSSIGGVSFTLYLLPELIPAITGGSVTAGVVTPSGTFANGIQTEPVFTPASGTASYGNLFITLADTSSAGVTQVGEVVRIKLQLPNHKAPATDSYILSTNGVVDLAGNPVTTLSAVVSEVILQ